MQEQTEKLLIDFFRTYTQSFSAKDFSYVLSDIGIKTSKNECLEMLETNENLFELTGGQFITKAGMFTNRCFSFSLTNEEILKKAFIVGHRTIPFTDPCMPTCNFTFLYNEKKLPKTELEINTKTVFDLFALYGQEFIPQYIEADKVTEKLDFDANDFVLPSKIKLTAFSIEPIIKAEGFSLRDRFLCNVRNWDKGIISISVLHNTSKPNKMNFDDIRRAEWCELLEKRLLESFDIIGPCASIEDQLSLVFAEYAHELCVPICGSVDEMLAHSKKIDFQSFGVETRLWRANEEVPAIGKWNNLEMVASSPQKINDATIVEPILQTIIDAYLKNLIYTNSADCLSVAKSVYPFFDLFHEQQKKSILLQLKSRYDTIKADYNRFADFEMAEMRKRILNLYTVVNDLVYKIDVSTVDLNLFPQQPLVILSQIFSHTTHIIDMSELEPNAVSPSVNEIMLSIEGMEYNFEVVSEQLKRIMKKMKKNGSSVVK